MMALKSDSGMIKLIKSLREYKSQVDWNIRVGKDFRHIPIVNNNKLISLKSKSYSNQNLFRLKGI